MVGLKCQIRGKAATTEILNLSICNSASSLDNRRWRNLAVDVDQTVIGNSNMRHPRTSSIVWKHITVEITHDVIFFPSASSFPTKSSNVENNSKGEFGGLYHVAGGQANSGWKYMFSQFFSTIKVNLVAKIMQSVYLYVIFHVKHKKLPFLAVLTLFPILGKTQDGGQDGGHCWWRHRPPAAPPPIKYTSSC